MKHRFALLGLSAALTASLLSGCSYMSHAKDRQQTFTLSQDVRQDSLAADQSNALTPRQEYQLPESISYRDLLSIREGQALMNGENYVDRLDLASRQKTRLLNYRAAAGSEDGGRLLYRQDQELFIYSVQSGKSWKIAELEREPQDDPMDVGAYFADKAGRYVIQKLAGDKLQLIDTDQGTALPLDLGTIFNTRSYGYGPLRYQDGQLYINIAGDGLDHGLYKFGADGQSATPVLIWPNQDDSASDRFEVLRDGSVLFSGSYNKEKGIFRYNPSTGKAARLVAGTKGTEGGRTPFFSLSPDESKLLFEGIVEPESASTDDLEPDFIYAAELSGMELTHIQPVLEQVYLYAAIFLMSNWEADSQAFSIKLPTAAGSEPSEWISSIAVYDLN
ncbi:hypothetical protein [Paenibacillus sp. SYP-B4298]|uniref:hypothetical protein n=1 Tax=Paenibacillus sp. SYP-B4298 TaxID=2996034 RepID=UPI0022DE5EBF|nr:hypothetical protein [Paenibacillus sp. SYP-B4298]